jgi:hypothetical protein
VPHEWRKHPALQKRFHPEHADDLQVIVHDGGPRISDRKPELVWVTLRVTEKYLRERPDWIIHPCENCGLSELFDAPSELMKAIFPDLQDGAVMESFTAVCGMLWFPVGPTQGCVG